MTENRCQCGRPIPDVANLCPTCGDLLRDRLHKIADRWPDLELALTSSGGPGGEQGKTKHGMVEVGTNVNEAAIRARRACTDAVWFAVQVIRDDCDTTDKPFTPPRTSANRSQDDTPMLARWLATWQVQHITHHTDRESAEEISNDVRRAEERTFDVCEKDRERKIPTGLPCENHGTSDLGERVNCDGTMAATLSDHMPDLVCSVDSTHRIPPDVWSRNYWKRSHHMDEQAARRLADTIRGA